MRCQPNCGLDRLGRPGRPRASLTAASNSGTICPSPNQPRSPPLAAEPSLEFALATSAKSLPPSISAFSAFALSSLSTRMCAALNSGAGLKSVDLGVVGRLHLGVVDRVRHRGVGGEPGQRAAALVLDGQPHLQADRSSGEADCASAASSSWSTSWSTSPVISTSSGRLWYCCRQLVAERDHMAEGDLGAVDGGEHGRGVVGLVLRPRPAWPGRCRPGGRRSKGCACLRSPVARRAGRAPVKFPGAPRRGGAVDRRGTAAYIPSRL